MFMGISVELLKWVGIVVPVSIVAGVIFGNIIGAIKYPNPEKSSVMGSGAKIIITVAVLLIIGLLAASFVFRDFGKQSFAQDGDMLVNGNVYDEFPSEGEKDSSVQLFDGGVPYSENVDKEDDAGEGDDKESAGEKIADTDGVDNDITDEKDDTGVFVEDSAADSGGTAPAAPVQARTAAIRLG